MTQVLTTQAQTLAGFWGGEVAGRFCMIYREQKVYRCGNGHKGRSIQWNLIRAPLFNVPNRGVSLMDHM